MFITIIIIKALETKFKFQDVKFDFNLSLCLCRRWQESIGNYNCLNGYLYLHSWMVRFELMIHLSFHLLFWKPIYHMYHIRLKWRLYETKDRRVLTFLVIKNRHSVPLRWQSWKCPPSCMLYFMRSSICLWFFSKIRYKMPLGFFQWLCWHQLCKLTCSAIWSRQIHRCFVRTVNMWNNAYLNNNSLHHCWLIVLKTNSVHLPTPSCTPNKHKM